MPGPPCAGAPSIADVLADYVPAAKTTPDQAPNPLKLNAQQQRIEHLIAFLQEHGKITSSQYQELCPDVSAESLRRDFVELVERGLIMRVGDKRGTHYMLK